jgi:hypothetical protein
MPKLIGVCELCGGEVYDYGPLRAINAYTCGRCGRWVCRGCGGYSPGYGYGVEDETRYGQVCKECYYELQADYASKWEAEFGSECEGRMENPYDLSEEEQEWQKQMREYKAWRDSLEQES